MTSNHPQEFSAVSAAATTAGDLITLLRHSRPLAKTWGADGTIKPYSAAKYFTHKQVPIGSLAALSKLLTKLQDDPHSCVIRGGYVGDEVAASRDLEYKAGKVRRTLDSFDDQPRHMVMLDVDGFTTSEADPTEAIKQFIQHMLPAAFHKAGYHYQLSNSAGHPTKQGGQLNAHLWFWLTEARTSAELKAWAEAEGIAVDASMFNAVQVHYTAGPVMDAGVVDPIAQRCGFVDGPPVELEIDVAVLALAVPLTRGRGQRMREVASDDPVMQRLMELDMVLTAGRDGYNIECPFADGHTPGSGSDTSTQYFLPNTGGYALGHFKCMHTSCAARRRGDYLAKLDIDEVGGEFSVVDSETGLLIEITSPPHSDDHLALHFAQEVQHRLRFTPGMGWMVAGPHQWARDDSEQRVDMARSVARAAAASADKPHERRALASLRTVNAMVTLAQSDPRLIVPSSDWDADPLVLNTPDGVVCLRTGAMRPHGQDLVTRTTSVAPDFEAECPHWMRFLDAVCGGDADLIEFMRRMLGYMLTGSVREQKIFFIWGQGANGKSTLSDLFLSIMGGYGLKLSSAVLMATKHERHPTELAQLKGVRAAVCSELEDGQFFNESRVKELTGDRTLAARFMGGDFFQFAMTQKHLVIGNHKPKLRGGDPAMARRMVLIPFQAAFKAESVDQDMPAKLSGEAPAILAWAVRGAVAWGQDGLKLPAVVRAASDAYMEDHNDLGQWIEEFCELGPECRGTANLLYSSFAQFKEARGEKAPSQVTWNERMAIVPGLERKRSNGSYFLGVRLLAGPGEWRAPTLRARAAAASPSSADFSAAPEHA